MPGIFVTATGTDVGKTFVTAGLVRAARRIGYPVQALKPLLSGYDADNPSTNDAGVLLAALGVEANATTIAQIAPWRFVAPLSPDMAAALEGRAIDPEAVIATCRDAVQPGRLTLIEGIGGVMVPIDTRHTILDLIHALDLPVVLVSGTALGALSHCLTAIAALRQRDRPPGLVVLNESETSTVPLEATLTTLRGFCPRTPFAIVPRRADEACFDRLFTQIRAL